MFVITPFTLFEGTTFQLFHPLAYQYKSKIHKTPLENGFHMTLWLKVVYDGGIMHVKLREGFNLNGTFSINVIGYKKGQNHNDEFV